MRRYVVISQNGFGWFVGRFETRDAAKAFADKHPNFIVRVERVKGKGVVKGKGAERPACPADDPRGRCADCGEPGERTGHMGCQYPQDHD